MSPQTKRAVVLAVVAAGAGGVFLVWRSLSSPQSVSTSKIKVVTTSDAGSSPEHDGSVSRTSAASSARPLDKSRTLDARKRRDALREDIYRGLGHPPPDRTATSPATRSLPPSSPVPLDRKYIQERIRSDFVPLASACYETLLATNPIARGKAVFSFKIVGDAMTGGIVESAELVEGTTLTDPEFSYCVSESLMSLSFAPPPNDGWVTVTYPLDFSPD